MLKENDILLVNVRQLHYGYSYAEKECRFSCVRFHPSLFARFRPCEPGRIFKQCLQQTPVQFLNAYRLEVSGSLLRDTDQSITEIAEHCGYRHKSHFAKAFSRCFGCTPREYRKKYQESSQDCDIAVRGL